MELEALAADSQRTTAVGLAALPEHIESRAHAYQLIEIVRNEGDMTRYLALLGLD